jgi:hypothetical protein
MCASPAGANPRLIAEEIFIAEIFHSHSMKKFRVEKSFHADASAAAGCETPAVARGPMASLFTALSGIRLATKIMSGSPQISRCRVSKG